MNRIFSECCLGGSNKKENIQQTKSAIRPIQVAPINETAPVITPTPDVMSFEQGGFSKNDISLRGLIARGAYAGVYKICGKNENDNISCKYVCKICDCNSSDGFMGAFLREICILNHLSSPRLKKYNKNIIPLLDIIYDISGVNTIGLVMPRRKYSLHHYMAKYEKTLENKHINFIISEILTGIHFIHQNGIVHRDIKPANILIDGDVVQICDFNLAKSIDGLHKLGSHSEEVVTAPYRAPEVWRKQRYSYPIDIWSVGVILLEMLMKRFIFHLYDSNINNTIVIKKLSMKYKINRFYRIMVQMLDFNQLTRITAANALKDPVFLNYKKNNDELIGIPPVRKVVEIIPNELSIALKKHCVLKDITKSLAGHILRVSRCSAENAALMAIKMCEDDLTTHFELDSYKDAEFEILKKMNFNLVISGKSEYFADK